MCVGCYGNKQGFISSGSVGIPLVSRCYSPFIHLCSWDLEFLAFNLLGVFSVVGRVVSFNPKTNITLFLYVPFNTVAKNNKNNTDNKAEN